MYKLSGVSFLFYDGFFLKEMDLYGSRSINLNKMVMYLLTPRTEINIEFIIIANYFKQVIIYYIVYDIVSIYMYLHSLS